ncbi:hypothetical protein DM806_07920 [Sphingobium lactosutens]|uniref:hypothetical protein n=1 Tax=Sphingobium lactosutens TaxID=522773 RepID=UPI0015BAA9D6|nr:hypothetical protein [Sphingobium lactosutens]NWK95597.1 hypothetical protein [Sphingobium lactosutens]
MKRFPSPVIGLSGMAAMLLLAGCAKSTEDGNAANNAAAPPTTVENIEEPDAIGAAGNETAGPPTDDWVGRWTGPEGLFLDIQPAPDGKPGHYAIANKDNLDRQADYNGVAEGSTIRFVRDGKDLAIRPGKGDETGFKYLAGKQDCLIVVPGQEGYCR